jgi:high-affinity nickel-transport protein
LFGAAFSSGMALVDGLDGYLAASTLSLAARGDMNARIASRFLGIVVVTFSFGLGGAELVGYEINQYALPLGLMLFAVVIAIRIWARSAWQPWVPASR